ncbi:putative UPF0496 protein 2 [Phoenix dactylifera]|uniref:UPF0496 protein 2 n=1 Tax=Phoenix dactylifera TaxID=42345 RepID=A0A8B7CTI8_PHODC|nr:putative UPF0496 protein 2 [Phoenix dactylifera]
MLIVPPDESPKTRHADPIKSVHLAVKEEYRGAFRSKSYTDICTQVQKHLKTTSSKRKSRNQDYTHLLEPKQEVLSSIIHCTTHLPSLLLDYFDASLHACNLCGSLIESIDQARADHRILRRVLELATASQCTEDQHHSMASNLVLFSKLDNPFSGPNPTRFERIHEAYGSMARQLVSAHRKLMRRLRCMNLGVGIGSAATCGVIAMVENVVVGEEGSVAREGSQLDAAARGAFALDRGFDTMSRMVRRLHDEVEHGRDVIRLFMEEEDMEGGWMMLREVVRELQLSEGRFMEQLAELEEHVCLCFLNINSARRMVLEEIVIPR